MRLAAAALCLGAIAAPPVFASDVYVPDNAPWFVLKEGKSAGVAVDMIALLAMRSGLQLDARGIPLARIARQLAQSDRAGFAIFARPEVLPAHLVQLGEPLDFPLLAIAPEEEPQPTLERLHLMAGVGLVHGAMRLLPADFIAGLSIREMPDVMSGLKMLENGRLRALLLTKVEMDLITGEQRARLHLGEPVQVGTLAITLTANEAMVSSEDARRMMAAWSQCLRDGSIAHLLAESTPR